MTRMTIRLAALTGFWLSLTAISLAQLPSGWQQTDIGSVGTAGSGSFSTGAFTVAGAGYGTIGTTTDRMHFVYQPLSGDGTIVARITGLSGFSSEAGVMIRETLDPDAKYAYTAGFPSGSSLYSVVASRTSTTGTSSFQALSGVPVPYWYKLVRNSNTFTGYLSPDGVNWVFSTSQTVSMTQNVYVGLVVASGTTSATATATFSHVSVSSTSVPAPAITSVSATTGPVGSEVLISGSGFGSSQGDSVVTLNGVAVDVTNWNSSGVLVELPSGATSGPLAVSVAPSMNYTNPVPFTVTSQPLPAGWLDRDVGAVGAVGSATYSSGTFTNNGAGYGAVSQTLDRLHFVYQPLSGDGVIIARLASASGYSPEAGVMIRETLESNAKQVYTNASPYGASFYLSSAARSSTGGSSSYTGMGVVSLPYWLKLVRSGSTFNSYVSSDGVNWGTGVTQTVSMSQNVFIGLATSSGTTSAVATATFDNGSVTGGVMPFVISLSPTSGPLGTSVTVNGASFGNTQGSSTLTFNGGEATSITSWSNTQIVADVPTTATTGAVVVNVNSVASNGNVIFDVHHPVIDSLSPPEAYSGATVIVDGHGFGTNPYSDHVYFNGVQASIGSWSDTSIFAYIPPTATSGPVTVVKGGVTSNGVSFTMASTPPTISGISPTSDVIGAWPITISGSGFGATQSNSTLKFWGSSASAQIISWSDTAITVVVPDDAITGPVTAKVGGYENQGPWFYVKSVAQLTDSHSNESTYTSLMIAGQWVALEAEGPGCSSCTIRGDQQNTIDSHGSLLTQTDALGHTVTYTYDSDFNMTSASQPLNVSTTATSTYTYNSFGQVLTATDPLGHVTTNTYDTHGNLLTVTTPSPDGGTTPGSVTTSTYDTSGQLLTITDPLNHTTTLTYISAGLIHTITDAQSHTTTYAYDARGNRTSVTDAQNHTTTFAYDIMGRLTGITYPGSTTVGFTYDSRGRRTSVTDQNSHTTSYTYDDADRLTAVSDAASHDTTYSYDTENNLTSITDANSHTTSFTYNPRGWVTQATFPSSLAETYAYDAIGNLTSKTDRKSQTIEYVYDALNRLTQKNYPDSTSVEYTYDLVGKIMEVNDPTGTYGFAYDNMGRLIGTTTEYSFLTGHTFTNAYTYDAASNRTGFTAPDSSTNSYTYDSLNRLSNLTNSLTGSFGFSYDPLSRRTQMTRPNGIDTNYTYDNLSRLLSVLHQSGSTTLDGASYTYDDAGNRTSKTDHLASVTSDYTYDALYQLTQVMQGSSTKESYSYDSVGNRLSSLGVSPYTYNSSNQLTSTPSATYTYDANGNTPGDGSKTYSWDFDNRLTSVTVPGTGTTTFRYDPLGRRIQKSGPLGTTNYLYDGFNLIEETDGSGNVLARYSRGLDTDEPLSLLRSGVTSYFQTDDLRSTTSLSSAAGSVAKTYTYDAFGNLTTSTGTLTNPFQFTGREPDSETGLRYYAIVESSRPLCESKPPKITGVHVAIAKHLAGLIEDGSVLQTGIGGIPDAVLPFLMDRKDLGVHIELVSDGVMRLVEAGVITGARKTFKPRKIIVGFVLRTRNLHFKLSPHSDRFSENSLGIRSPADEVHLPARQAHHCDFVDGEGQHDFTP